MQAALTMHHAMTTAVQFEEQSATILPPMASPKGWEDHGEGLGVPPAAAVHGWAGNGDAEAESGSTGSPFDSLLSSLAEEHNREVAALESEVSDLRAALQDAQTPRAPKPHSGKGGQNSADCHPAAVELSDGKPEDESDAKSAEGHQPELRICTSVSDPCSSQGLKKVVKFQSRTSTEQGSANGGGYSNTRSMGSSGTPRRESVSNMLRLLPEWQQATQPKSMVESVILSQAANFQRMAFRDASIESRTTSGLRLRLQRSQTSNIAVPTFRMMIQNGSCILHPASKFPLFWDMFGMIALAFDVVWVPYLVFDPPTNLMLDAIQFLLMMYWTLDMMISFITGYYTKDGNLVMEFRRIARKYVKGYFLMDCAIVANDWIGFTFKMISENGGNDSASLVRVAKVARVMRTFRAARLLRLLKIREVIIVLQEHIDSEAISIMLNICINIAMLVVIAHLVACGWFWLANHSYEDNWLAYHELLHATHHAQYFAAMHWSVTQFTPASMEIFPRNVPERAFTVFVVIFSLILFSSFVGAISSGIMRLRTIQASRVMQYYTLRKFLSENAISRDLSARILRYAELAWELHQKKMDANRVQLLGFLSGPLRVELQRELFEGHLTAHVFFEDYRQVCSAALNQLCFTAVKKAAYSKNDQIFEGGTKAVQMCFVIGGTLMYRRISGLGGKKTVLLGKDEFCSEAVLWVPWIHCGTMISLVESEMVAIHSKLFREVTVSHPMAFVAARTYALEYVDAMHSCVESGRQWHDVEQALMYPPNEAAQAEPHSEPEEVQSRRTSKRRETHDTKFAEVLHGELFDASFLDGVKLDTPTAPAKDPQRGHAFSADSTTFMSL